MKNHLLLCLLLTSVALPNHAIGQDAYPLPVKKPPLEARVEAGIRPGTERSIALTEFWVPIAQNPIDGSVMYGDLRMMGDDQDNREFNIGAGYRKMVQSALLGAGIVGGHVWFDRRLTDRGSAFNQATAGMEWFSDIWDAKINAYLPLNDSKTYSRANPNGPGGGFAGNQIVVNTDQTFVEEAMPGLDLELGVKVPFLDEVTDSTRLYGGVYHFEGDRAKDVSGWRTRITSDITSDIQVGARFQRDDVRGSQGFLEATIRFPFGNKQSYQSQGLYARLDESPERDIDIVSNEVVTDPGLNVPLVNTVTGTVQEIFHVDNTAAPGGNGSNEARFNTLAAAQAAAGPNDIIYVHRGNGTNAGQNAGITLSQSGQMLIGSGSDFTFETARFNVKGTGVNPNQIIIPKTSTPVITNGAGSGITVTGANAFISGLSVNGTTANGIFVNAAGGNDLGSILIDNVTANNNIFEGIRIESNGSGSNIKQSIIKNTTTNANTGRGILVYSLNDGDIVNSTIEGATTNNNLADGILVQSNNAGSLITQSTILNTIANGNTARGIIVFASNNGNIINSMITSTTASNNLTIGILTLSQTAGSLIGQSNIQNTITNGNAQRGIQVYALSDGDITNSTITGTTSNNNTQDGILIASQIAGSVIGQSTIQNTITNGNTLRGTIIFADLAGDIMSSNITGLTSNNNLLEGIYITSQQNSSDIINAVLQSSTMTGNGSHGLQIQGLSNATLNSSVIKNIINGNTGNGVFIDDQTSSPFVVDLGGGALGSTGGNQIFGNTGTDIRVDLDGGQLKAENNWWGVGTGLAGGEVTLDAGSTIDANPFLTSAP
jgi:hypothetical protein